MGLLKEGQSIRGTYEVERFLGEGAFAEVYRVKHRFLGRQAMKVFKIVGMGLEEVEQYLDEAIILSRISHPNIVQVYDANITETSKGICGFFTMEFIAGGSLDQFWRSYGTHYVPIETAVEILRQVCSGISIAHREKPPIIHRDIKPQNILVGYDTGGLRARVSDFGLAKRVNPMTLMASAKGTRCFKPPEVFQDYQTDSRAGDVWAIGSVLYLLLTDRLPFSEPGDMDTFDPKSFEKPMILPSRLNIQVDPGLDRILLKALALDPKERYPSALEFREDLMNWKQVPFDQSQRNQKDKVTIEGSKNALGAFSPADQTAGEKMANHALEIARRDGKLLEAADIMEEAFNKWPDLRNRYESHLKVWRRGISM